MVWEELGLNEVPKQKGSQQGGRMGEREGVVGGMRYPIISIRKENFPVPETDEGLFSSGPLLTQTISTTS